MILERKIQTDGSGCKQISHPSESVLIRLHLLFPEEKERRFNDWRCWLWFLFTKISD